MKELEIRSNSINRLKSINIQFSSILPDLNSVSTSRRKEEICNRINTMHLLYTIGENPECKEDILSILNSNFLIDYLDKEEERALNLDPIPSDAILNMEWYKESIKALLWSISLVKELDSSANEDFISNYFHLMPPEIPFEDFTTNANKRDDETIVLEADYLYCYHYWIKHFYKKGDKGQKISVIRERRRALEWIIQPYTSWYDLSLDT